MALPRWGNAIKLSEFCDDYYGFKVHRFEGLVLFLAHIVLTLSGYVRSLRTLRTLSNLSG